MSSRALSDGVRWLIAGACIVTFFATTQGLRSMWEVAEPATHMSRFIVCDALPLALVLIVLAAYLPAWRLPRLMRVAVLLPLIHLGMLLVVAQLWSLLRADMTTLPPASETDLSPQVYQAAIAAPSFQLLGLAFAAIIVIAIAIKRRHGEWAHAMVMLTLATLLLIGLWLPLVSLMWNGSSDSLTMWRQLQAVAADPSRFIAVVVVPPALVAIAITAVAFRAPSLFARVRRGGAIAAKVALVLVVSIQLNTADRAAVLYLQHSYIILFAIVLAILALANLILITWLRSWLAYRKLQTLTSHTGVVTSDDGEVAVFEIASWLRGPRIVTRAFSVTTNRGIVPVTGAAVLAHVPATTTGLAIGETAQILAPGHHVVIATRSETASGHPFRAMDVTNVLLVAPVGTRPYTFADIALVAWRPAVAYLAILIAVALPGLAIVLT